MSTNNTGLNQGKIQSDKTDDHIIKVTDTLLIIDEAMEAYLKSRKLREEIRKSREDKISGYDRKSQMVSDDKILDELKTKKEIKIKERTDKIAQAKAKVQKSRLELKNALADLIKIKQTLLKKNDLKPDQESVDEAFEIREIKSKIDELKKIRDLLEMEIVAINEMRNLEHSGLELPKFEPEILIDKLEGKAEHDWRFELDSNKSEKEKKEAAALAEKEKVKKLAQEMGSGAEGELGGAADREAREGGYGIYWAIVKKPVMAVVTGIITFISKGIIYPLYDGFKELRDAARSIRRGGARHVANGLLKGGLIIGGAVAIGYGVAAAIAIVGTAALLANPVSLAGAAAILGVLLATALVAKLFASVAKLSKIIADEVFDKELDIYKPSKNLIRIKKKEQAYEIAAFFRKEIKAEKKAMDNAATLEEKNIHREIHNILEQTFQSINKVSTEEAFKEVWQQGLKKINELQKELNYVLLEKHVNRVNDGIKHVLQKKPKNKEARLNTLVSENRKLIIHQLKMVQGNWKQLKEKSKTYSNIEDKDIEIDHDKDKKEQATPIKIAPTPPV